MTDATIKKVVMLSAAEAKLGALFLNANLAVYLRQILTKWAISTNPNSNQQHDGGGSN
jgi:hypothetical protein